jgi:hypothetical protein
MKIKWFRLLTLLLLAWIIFRHKYVLIGYWLVLVAVVEFLNSSSSISNKQRINQRFFYYLLFITIVRTSHYVLPQWMVYIINAIEHLLFALAVSYMVYLVLGLSVKMKQLNTKTTFFLIALLFNGIGILNEVYQCLAKAKPAFYFLTDKGSLIDLAVNVVGSVLFTVLMWNCNGKRIKNNLAE